MNIFQAIILGLIQGTTEFIPVSSSGHLAALPKVFGWPEQPLVFDTTMHLATAAALVIYFRRDLFLIVKGFLSDLFKRGINFKHYSKEGRMALYMVVGAIPAGILGLLFQDYFDTLFRGLLSISIFLAAGGLLMIYADKLGKQNKKLSFDRALGIGFFQSLALFPGVSRSGATISGGLFLGLNREEAARFSFLLSIPIIVAAGLYQLVKSPGVLSSGITIPLAVGFAVSFLSGLWAIGFLLKYLKNNKLTPFVIYRLVLAVILMGIAILA